MYAFTVSGVPAQAFDAWNLGMLTSSEFGNAEVRDGYNGGICSGSNCS